MFPVRSGMCTFEALSSVSANCVALLTYLDIGVAVVIGIAVSLDDPRLALNASSSLPSPFVSAIQRARTKVLPGVVHGGVLASGLSAADSELFTSSGTLHVLAIRRHAPRIFGCTSSYGVSYVAIIPTAYSALWPTCPSARLQVQCLATWRHSGWGAGSSCGGWCASSMSVTKGVCPSGAWRAPLSRTEAPLRPSTLLPSLTWFYCEPSTAMQVR